MFTVGGKVQGPRKGSRWEGPKEGTESGSNLCWPI